MQIGDRKFHIPKKIEKLIEGDAIFHDWGIVKQNEGSSRKEEGYILQKCPYPLAPEYWMVVSEDYIKRKKLKLGDEFGIIEYSIQGRTVFDVFKEIPTKQNDF
jgi:hypothetical protein